jgi:hypothetical protein
MKVFAMQLSTPTGFSCGWGTDRNFNITRDTKLHTTFTLRNLMLSGGIQDNNHAEAVQKGVESPVGGSFREHFSERIPTGPAGRGDF